MILRFLSIATVAILLSAHPDGIMLVNARACNRLGAQKTPQTEARRIWEQSVSAKGGRERLQSVQNVAISTIGNYTNGSGKSNTVRTEAFFAFPNKIWRWMDYRPDVLGLTVETYNFDTGVKYIINSDNHPPIPQAVRPTEKSTGHSHGLLSYFLETKWLKPELVSASTGRMGRRTVDVVHTMVRDDVEGFAPETTYIDFAFDHGTHLPIRVSYYHTREGKEVFDLVENLSEYMEVKGIKVPRRREIDGSVEKIDVQINVEYNKDLFERPPSVAAGTGAWRLRAK